MLEYEPARRIRARLRVRLNYATFMGLAPLFRHIFIQILPRSRHAGNRIIRFDRPSRFFLCPGDVSFITRISAAKLCSSAARGNEKLEAS